MRKTNEMYPLVCWFRKLLNHLGISSHLRIVGSPNIEGEFFFLKCLLFLVPLFSCLLSFADINNHKIIFCQLKNPIVVGEVVTV